MILVPIHPFCGVCGWRTGGVDSWNGRACKCSHSSPAFVACSACNYAGLIKGKVCSACGGAGIVNSGEKPI